MSIVVCAAEDFRRDLEEAGWRVTVRVRGWFTKYVEVKVLS